MRTSRSEGVDLMDGNAVRDALQGADAVIDTSNVKTGAPGNHTLETAGPEIFAITDMAIEILAAHEDGRRRGKAHCGKPAENCNDRV